MKKKSDYVKEQSRYQNTDLIAGDFGLHLFQQLNPFAPNAPFLYPVKTSENRKVF